MKYNDILLLVLLGITTTILLQCGTDKGHQKKISNTTTVTETKKNTEKTEEEKKQEALCTQWVHKHVMADGGPPLDSEQVILSMMFEGTADDIPTEQLSFRFEGGHIYKTTEGLHCSGIVELRLQSAPPKSGLHKLESEELSNYAIWNMRYRLNVDLKNPETEAIAENYTVILLKFDSKWTEVEYGMYEEEDSMEISETSSFSRNLDTCSTYKLHQQPTMPPWSLLLCETESRFESTMEMADYTQTDFELFLFNAQDALMAYEIRGSSISSSSDYFHETESCKIVNILDLGLKAPVVQIQIEHTGAEDLYDEEACQFKEKSETTFFYLFDQDAWNIIYLQDHLYSAITTCENPENPNNLNETTRLELTLLPQKDEPTILKLRTLEDTNTGMIDRVDYFLFDGSRYELTDYQENNNKKDQ